MNERKFDVIVFPKDSKKGLVYFNLTAKKAIELMAKMKARGLDSLAQTSTQWAIEELTLEDMKAITGELNYV